ncbi:MAG: PIN domain nuclease [Thermoanaerobaculia bacterium]|nr:PIN domain nuclease [Thermoanaerobaculia bacterium]
MIVVDTSALIEYYRPGGTRLAQEAVAEAIELDAAAVNGIIQVELIAFARDDSSQRKLTSDLRCLHYLPLELQVFELSIDLGFGLRRKGITVPATDLIIAASALRAGALLYHLDSHYDQIAQHSALLARNLSTGL